MSYYYTVENRTQESGGPVEVETIYPLSVGMHTQIFKDGVKEVVKVVEMIVYDDEAVIVVEDA